MRQTERISLLCGGLLAVLAASPSAACTLSATGVSFGTYDQGGAPTDGVGSIQAVCHPSDQAPTVSLSAGNSGSFATRQLRSGGHNLNYNLYSDGGQVWGNGGGNSSTVTLTNGTVHAGRRTFIRTIYGRIPAGQKPAAGSYSDTIVMTITF